MVLCKFVNVTRVAMVKKSGIPEGPYTDLGHDKFIGINWEKCESFCKNNNECNSFVYFPNMPEIKQTHPSYTCILKKSNIKETVDFYMTPSRCLLRFFSDSIRLLLRFNCLVHCSVVTSRARLIIWPA